MEQRHPNMGRHRNSATRSFIQLTFFLIILIFRHNLVSLAAADMVLRISRAYLILQEATVLR